MHYLLFIFGIIIISAKQPAIYSYKLSISFNTPGIIPVRLFHGSQLLFQSVIQLFQSIAVLMHNIPETPRTFQPEYN